MFDFDLATERLTERLECGLRQHRGQRAADAADRLLPELAATFPCTCITQFEASSDYVLLPAETILETVDEGPQSFWRTAEAVQLHPFNVSSAMVERSTKDLSLPSEVQSIMRLTLSAGNDDTVPERFTLYLNGVDEETFAWCQIFNRDVLNVSAQTPDGEVVPISCRAKEGDSRLFSIPDGLPLESRLLNELFFCPQNFFFIELSKLPPCKQSIELVFTLGSIAPAVSSNLFCTRCVAVVNDFCRELPMIEIDPTKDEWELHPPNGEVVSSLLRVESYSRETGQWSDCDRWQMVRRRGRAMLAFQSPMFEPADPPSRYIRAIARCRQPVVDVSRIPKMESNCGYTAEIMTSVSPAVQPRRGSLSRWFSSGHAEPLTEGAFSRLLVQQAVLRGKVAVADRPTEVARRQRARQMIMGMKLISIDRDEYQSRTGEVVHGRRVTIEVKPEYFPGRGYWPALQAVSQFLAAAGPINCFTRIAVIKDQQEEVELFPPFFGRRASL